MWRTSHLYMILDHAVHRGDLLDLLQVDAAEVLDRDGAPHLISLVVPLRVDAQEGLAFRKVKVCENGIDSVLLAPLQVVGKHVGRFLDVVVPRSQEAQQRVAVCMRARVLLVASRSLNSTDCWRSSHEGDVFNTIEDS